MEVYLEPILPDPTLFIFGAGHVGQRVAPVVKGIGFKVAVVDDRIKYASRDRFPDADALYVDTWEEVFKKLPVNDSSYLLIATRGHNYDLACLRFAVLSPAKYIGMIGSKRKVVTILADLLSQGVALDKLLRVHAPIGLEIGAVTVPEIAVSILAELVAVRRGRGGEVAKPLKFDQAKLREALEDRGTAR